MQVNLAVELVQNFLLDLFIAIGFVCDPCLVYLNALVCMRTRYINCYILLGCMIIALVLGSPSLKGIHVQIHRDHRVFVPLHHQGCPWLCFNRSLRNLPLSLQSREDLGGRDSVSNTRTALGTNCRDHRISLIQGFSVHLPKCILVRATFTFQQPPWEPTSVTNSLLCSFFSLEYCLHCRAFHQSVIL